MSELLKRRFVDQIKVLFGAEPTKPKEISPATPVSSTRPSATSAYSPM